MKSDEVEETPSNVIDLFSQIENQSEDCEACAI